MADIYRVKTKAVKVSIGSLDGNRVARILTTGAIVPEGVAEESLVSLAKRGLIEKVKPAAKGTRSAQKVKADGDGAKDDGDGNGPKADGDATPPPKSGNGSSAEAWLAYAQSLDVEVPAGASRDDVIAAIEAAGKPTE